MIPVMDCGDRATRTNGRGKQRPSRRGDGAGHPAMANRYVGSPWTCWVYVDVAHRQGPGRHLPNGRAVDLDTLVVGALLAAPGCPATTGRFART